jgi:hypothetical protein
LRELSKRLMQGLRLLRRWMQLDSHGSVHRTKVPYMLSFCKSLRKEGPHSSPA